MEEAVMGYTKLIISQLDCFRTSLNRRLDEICEINEYNCKKFCQLLIKPVLRLKVLAKDGVDPPFYWGYECSKLQCLYYSATVRQLIVSDIKQLPIHTVTLETASEARPCHNVKVGGEPLTTYVFPQACPTPLPFMPMKPDECQPLGG
ncbi:unnamed protein product [Linum trigynum]|uniref:Uncharacterized protein n=1 Tax=Linum trigynum TaxID=586398 RepID=A0AAV2DWC8_9ROSI